MAIIYDWVNQPYAHRFWQLNGSLEELQASIDAVLNSPYAHSFIAMKDTEPLAQVDCYLLAADELGQLVQHQPNDCGLHLLMQPPKQSYKNAALEVLKAFIDWYFSFPESGDLYAEPDEANLHANRLAIKAGFELLQPVRLSNKNANLYRITRHRTTIHQNK